MTLITRLIALLALVVLAACGGGSGGGTGGSPFGGAGTGGSGGGTGTTTPQPTLVVTVAPETVTAAVPAQVKAQLLSATGAGIPGQVVQFSVPGGFGKLSAPSALTNAEGIASVTLTPATPSTDAADVVTASVSVGGTALSASDGVQFKATDVSIAAFSADIGSASLAAYGQTTLTVKLSTGAAGSPVTVTVNSECVTQGRATLTPSSQSTTSGTASFVYRDQGCGANQTDRLTAAVVGSGAAPTTLQLQLTQPLVASISFVSASPQTIFLRGSGFAENSLVTFRVLDAAGNGVRGQQVLLEPTTTAGGIRVDDLAAGFPIVKQTDNNGNVVVRVNSGTVPTPVRILARIDAGGVPISTVSSTLAVAVGLPSQLNFSLSQGTLNLEGYNIDGTRNTYSVIASDRLGNPVPDGTAINFVTEGGQVQAIAFTATNQGLSGASVNFQSSAPRPVDGRVTVLAYALGEKSFLDQNGDNRYSDGEVYQELGDPYLDRLYNGVYDPLLDQFIAQSPAGTFSCSQEGLPSVLAAEASAPSRPDTCTGQWGRAYVRRAIETVFSTSAARPLWGRAWPAGAASGSADGCAGVTLLRENGQGDQAAYDATGVAQTRTYYPFGGTALYGQPAAGVLSVIVADANPFAYNPMAAGTTISAAATEGLTVSVAGGSPVPNTLRPTSVAINYAFADDKDSGAITLTFRSPSGFTTAYSQFITKSSLPSGFVTCQGN